MNSKILLLLSIAALGLGSAAHAQPVALDVDIRLGHALPPPPPEVVVDPAGPGGPPPWAAEHHWYRRSYDYYYYPGCDVYFRPSDRMWFYLDGRTWRAAARLPDGVRVDFGRAVSLKLESDRPYTFHDKVAAYYPANYFAKVKFKNDRDNHRDDDHGRDDHGRDDRGRDNDRDHDRHNN